MVILAKNDADLPTADGSRDVRTNLVNPLKRLMKGLGPGVPRLEDAMSAVQWDDGPRVLPGSILLLWTTGAQVGCVGICVGGCGKLSVRSTRSVCRGGRRLVCGSVEDIGEVSTKSGSESLA